MDEGRIVGVIRRAHRLDPLDLHIVAMLGRTLCEIGELDEAVRVDEDEKVPVAAADAGAVLSTHLGNGVAHQQLIKHVQLRLHGLAVGRGRGNDR